MPGTDWSVDMLRNYTGSFPCPDNFAEFWNAVKKEIDETSIDLQMEPVAHPNPNANYYHVTLTAPDSCKLHAKYICPSREGTAVCTLTFHDYPGASRGWHHLTRYIAIDSAVLAPDCRGQGGYSENGTVGAGPAAYGPMFNGLEGEITEMYLFHLFRDALLWAKAAMMLSKTDPEKLYVYGDGQGGSLAIACAAMYPQFKKCAAHYPMLCDYKRVWDKDFDQNAYAGLRFFFRWHDPLHEREEEIFRKLSYMDAVNFAPMVKAKVLVSTGLQDVVSPPSAQFALYNKLDTEKKHMVYPKHGHELNNFFENELLKFLIV